MYQTSADYKTAMRSASRPYDTVYGTITLTTGDVIDIDGSDMPTNSISISKQCIDGGELMFGGVFLSTLKLSIIPDADHTSRYLFFGATIDLTYKVQIGMEGNTPVYEEVPLGIFVVADADKPSDRLNLTAYDKMTLLDKELGSLVISGTPWEILTEVENQTGYPLGFNEAYVNTFLNPSYPITCSSDQGLKTFRDVVKVVCQQLACFALDDRTGQLTLKTFSMQPDLSLDSSAWYSIVPADYMCNYVALSITSLKGTFIKTDPNPNLVGNMMIVEDAPAWDYGIESVLQTKLDNIYDMLTDIDYTPCDIEMPSDPSFDCGDRLYCALRDGSNIATIITSLEWKFHQGMTITSEGINPYLEGGSALATESQRILSQAVERSKLQFVNFTNSSAKVIGDSQTVEIGSCNFTPTTNANALFVGTILVDADVADIPITINAYNGSTPAVVTDLQGNTLTLTSSVGGECSVTVFYTLKAGNETETKVPTDADPYLAIEELTDGRHIITLSYPFSALTEFVNFTFKIWITVSGGTITVPAHTLQATIFGQEITNLEGFSGHLVVEDTMPLVDIGSLPVSVIRELTDFVVNIGGTHDTTIPNQIFLTAINEWIHPQPSENLVMPTIGGIGTDDPITDESGNAITDESGNDIIAEDKIVSNAITPIDYTESVSLQLVADESLLLRCGDDYYAGEDMSAGLFNTLYDGGSNE